MAASCFVCDCVVCDSRERKSLLDKRTRHVLLYLDQLVREVDVTHDQFARFIEDDSQQPRAFRPYICKRCFLRCEKAHKHRSKAKEVDDILSNSLTARMAKLNADNLSDWSEDEADTRPRMPKQPRLESVIPSARRMRSQTQVLRQSQ